MDEADWSAADARGIRTKQFDVGAKSTLRGRRLRRRDDVDIEACAAWPADWCSLARDWLGGSATPRWSTLVGSAGLKRSALALDLLDALLIAGWIELEEKREDGRWRPQKLAFREFEALRERLGLPHRDKLALQAQAALEPRFDHVALDTARVGLLTTAPALAIRRHGLLVQLARWIADERSGTRRDFALFATADTKGISDADWNWLTDTLTLSELGVEAHTPLMLLRAPFAALDVPDFIGLTPAAINAGLDLKQPAACWRLIENRTSFERAARRYGHEDGVVWLPGYPPQWWLDSMRSLLAAFPAPAWIACDPDPAGIEIALGAAALWESVDLDWTPWHMDAAVLDKLPSTKPLSEDDRQRLDRLAQRPLPPSLSALASALLERGIKGEQEGLGEL